jgi:ATP-dependent DNA helicase PIF1
MYPEEFLNTLHPAGLPSHKLRLKVGAPVLLIRNLNPAKHLMNGTRLIITELHDKYIVGRIQPPAALPGMSSSLDAEDCIHIIPRIRCCPTEDNMALNFIRTQLPLLLALCMTINKSQGQTFTRVGLFLKNAACFSHGQLYVALSRVGDPAAIRVLPGKDAQIEGRDGTFVDNVVYKSAFPS